MGTIAFSEIRINHNGKTNACRCSVAASSCLQASRVPPASRGPEATSLSGSATQLSRPCRSQAVGRRYSTAAHPSPGAVRHDLWARQVRVAEGTSARAVSQAVAMPPAIASSSCWFCGESIEETEHPLFCDNCGYLQPPRPDQNLFRLFQQCAPAPIPVRLGRLHSLHTCYLRVRLV